MRFYRSITSRWTGDRYQMVSCLPFDYVGPVALAKGDDVAKQTELMQQQNMQTQMAFQSQLMDIFKQQFGKQNAVMDYLQAKMQPMIDKGGEGYSPDALTAMRTNATDNLSTSYQNAQRALQATRFAQGGRDLPSGVDAQLDAALMQSEASDKAGAQTQITLQNENLKQQNYWNAVNELNGIGATFNPQSYAGAATNAGNTAVGAGNSVANLSQAVTASQQSGLMGMLGGLAGGVFGAAGKAGGFGALFSCWLAAKTFKEDFATGIKTGLVRAWLYNVWAKHWYARPILWMYSKLGKQASQYPSLVKVFSPLFESAARTAWVDCLNAA